MASKSLEYAGSFSSFATFHASSRRRSASALSRLAPDAAAVAPPVRTVGTAPSSESSPDTSLNRISPVPESASSDTTQLISTLESSPLGTGLSQVPTLLERSFWISLAASAPDSTSLACLMRSAL